MSASRCGEVEIAGGVRARGRRGSAVKSAIDRSSDLDGERLGTQALAVAGRAGRGGHVLQHAIRGSSSDFEFSSESRR